MVYFNLALFVRQTSFTPARVSFKYIYIDLQGTELYEGDLPLAI